MEEENKTVETAGTEKKETGTEKKEIKVSLSEKVLNSLFAICALVALAFTRVLWRFGVGSTAFNGIMTIVVLGLAVTGLLWNYLRYKKPNLEFFFSAGVAFVAFLAM